MSAVAWARNNRISLTDHQKGQVHSVFRHSLNLQFGKRLIHLSDGRYGRLPFGLIIERNELARLLAVARQGQCVRWEEVKQCLYFAGLDQCLSLARIPEYVNQLSRLEGTVAEANQAAFRNCLLAAVQPCGLGYTAAQAVAVLDGCYLAGAQQEELVHLSLLQQLTASRDKGFINDTLRYFIGRGAGLTPSGDDMLVGFFAAAISRGSISPVLNDQFTRLLADEGERLTTSISLEYLHYAGHGEFGSQIIDLLDALYNGAPVNVIHHTRRILRNGHTSGMDTLIGMMVQIGMSERSLNKINCIRSEER